MKPSAFRALLPSLLAAGLVYATFPISQVKRVTNVPIVPNQFIIEVDSIANIPTKRSFSRVRRNILLPLIFINYWMLVSGCCLCIIEGTIRWFWCDQRIWSIWFVRRCIHHCELRPGMEDHVVPSLQNHSLLSGRVCHFQNTWSCSHSSCCSGSPTQVSASKII